jgi:alanyl-tRNA synthetase
MADVSKLASGAKKVGETTLIATRIPDGIAVDDLRKIALELRNRDSDSVIALVSVVDSKPVLVVAVSDAARTRGVKAGALVKLGSTVLGGGGGGKDDFAQGGGTEISAIDQALQAIELAISGK